MSADRDLGISGQYSSHLSWKVSPISLIIIFLIKQAEVQLEIVEEPVAS